jgi:hypothetical protein
MHAYCHSLTSIDQAVQASLADHIYPSVILVISKARLMPEQQALGFIPSFSLQKMFVAHPTYMLTLLI